MPPIWDSELRRLTGPHGAVVLSPILADALTVLLANSGRLVTKDRLLTRLYGASLSAERYPKGLDVLMTRLRARLRESGVGWRITTVWSEGWVLEGVA
jgi:DNA-binding response OmpR family regulator